MPYRSVSQTKGGARQHPLCVLEVLHGALLCLSTKPFMSMNQQAETGLTG